METDGMAGYDYDADALAEVMIQKHCEWLNLWTRWEAAEHPTWGHHLYRSSDFSERNEWGWRKVVGTIYSDFDPESLILAVNIHDGDEGGSQTLTGFFNARTTPHYAEGKGTNWTGYVGTMQELRQRGCAYEDMDYHHSELEGWDLVSLVQEFDTMHTMVLREGRFINTPDDSRLGFGSSDDASSASSAMQIDVGKG